jgi:hypothetical protein
MRLRAQLNRRWLAVVLGGLLGCALLATLAWPVPPDRVQAQAHARWEARPFSNYQITVQIQRSDTFCLQELEVGGDGAARPLRDTCGSSWFSRLSVARLFDFGSRADQAPSCYPSAQLCTCQQLRIGQVKYDQTLGYPVVVDYERRLRPNLLGLDYWQFLWQQHRIPNCEPSSRPVRLTVVALTPIP